MTSRRTFVKNSGVAALAAFSGITFFDSPSSLISKPGLGLFSIPGWLNRDLSGALAGIAKMGYKEIEVFGPYSFSTEKAKASWAPAAQQLGLKESGLFGKSAKEFGALSKSYGLSIPAMHTDLDTLMNNFGPLAEAANALGAQYVVLPALPEEFRKTLDDYKKSADLFNKIGEQAKKTGIRFGYHNHGYGLQVKDGKMPLDIILDETDPSLVYFEMDLFWTVAGGADPISLLSKHKGRYTMMHVKDMKEQKRFAGDGNDMRQWMPLFPYMCSAGSGVLPLNKILKAAKENGMTHFFVEQDLVADPETALQKSLDYLKGL